MFALRSLPSLFARAPPSSAHAVAFGPTRLVARAFTRVTAIGRVGSDPELRTLESGVKVVSFPLAAHRTEGSGDNRKEITMWFRCFFFDQPKLTQYVDEQIVKGALVLVDGELSQRRISGKDGDRDRETIATEIFLGRGGKIRLLSKPKLASEAHPELAGSASS